jgi:hypothetical protein
MSLTLLVLSCLWPLVIPTGSNKATLSFVTPMTFWLVFMLSLSLFMLSYLLMSHVCPWWRLLLLFAMRKVGFVLLVCFSRSSSVMAARSASSGILGLSLNVVLVYLLNSGLSAFDGRTALLIVTMAQQSTHLPSSWLSTFVLLFAPAQFGKVFKTDSGMLVLVPWR